jgi:hypothetical protein
MSPESGLLNGPKRFSDISLSTVFAGVLVAMKKNEIQNKQVSFGGQQQSSFVRHIQREIQGTNSQIMR